MSITPKPDPIHPTPHTTTPAAPTTSSLPHQADAHTNDVAKTLLPNELTHPSPKSPPHATSISPQTESTAIKTKLLANDTLNLTPPLPNEEAAPMDIDDDFDIVDDESSDIESFKHSAKTNDSSELTIINKFTNSNTDIDTVIENLFFSLKSNPNSKQIMLFNMVEMQSIHPKNIKNSDFHIIADMVNNKLIYHPHHKTHIASNRDFFIKHGIHNIDNFEHIEMDLKSWNMLVAAVIDIQDQLADSQVKRDENKKENITTFTHRHFAPSKLEQSGKQDDDVIIKTRKKMGSGMKKNVAEEIETSARKKVREKERRDKEEAKEQAYIKKDLQRFEEQQARIKKEAS